MSYGIVSVIWVLSSETLLLVKRIVQCDLMMLRARLARLNDFWDPEGVCAQRLGLRYRVLTASSYRTTSPHETVYRLLTLLSSGGFIPRTLLNRRWTLSIDSNLRTTKPVSLLLKHDIHSSATTPYSLRESDYSMEGRPYFTLYNLVFTGCTARFNVKKFHLMPTVCI
jgi:hypothetical protein